MDGHQEMDFNISDRVQQQAVLNKAMNFRALEKRKCLYMLSNYKNEKIVLCDGSQWLLIYTKVLTCLSKVN